MKSARQLNTSASQELNIGGTVMELGEFSFKLLTAVVERRYQPATEIINEYKKMKASYPQYTARTDRLFVHAEELINAISAKKNFPNLSSLAQSKQEEIHQRAGENFEDLKVTLRRIRSIEKDMAAADARSSVWVIWSVIFMVSILSFAFILNEAFRSFGHSLPVVLDRLSNNVFDFFKLE